MGTVSNVLPRLYSLGRVVRCLPHVGTHESRPLVKVRVVEQEFDDYFKAFFDKPVVHLAFVSDSLLQNKLEVSVGDSVLLKRLDKSVQSMEHEVDRIVFKRGHIKDPVNKQKVVNAKYVNESNAIDTFISDALKSR